MPSVNMYMYFYIQRKERIFKKRHSVKGLKFEQFIEAKIPLNSTFGAFTY